MIESTEKDKNQARWQLVKYTLCVILVAAVLLAAGVFAALKWHYILLPVIWILGYPLYRIAYSLLAYAFFYSTLFKSVNAPIFWEITRHSAFFGHSKTAQILAEGALGNYPRAIAIAKEQLAMQGTEKLHLLYYAHLANFYFETENAAELQSVCEDGAQLVAALPQNSKKRAQFGDFAFYTAFLAKDYAACREFLNTPAPTHLGQVRNSYRLARVTLAEGCKEEARAILTQLVEQGERICYTELAQRELARLGENEGS